jgi:hypothetical protein
LIANVASALSVAWVALPTRQGAFRTRVLSQFRAVPLSERGGYVEPVLGTFRGGPLSVESKKQNTEAFLRLNAEKARYEGNL